MLDKMFGIGVLLSLQNRMSPVAKQAQRDLRQLEGEVDDLEGRLKKFNGFQSLANKGRSLTTSLTVPILATAGLVTKASMDMGRAMGQVATLIPGQEKRVAELQTFVEETAMATGKSTSDLATAAYQSISLLGDASGQTESMISAAAKAAVAGQASVTESVNLLGGVLRAYEMDASQASKVSDLLFTTVQRGATTFPELASSMGRVLGMSASLNLPLEDITAAFATLTGVTGNTAEVSTQVAGVINKFLQPTQAMEKAVEALGYSSGKAMLSSEGFAGALKLLTEYSQATKTPLADLFPDVEGLRAAMALTGKNAETFAENLNAMRHASGATEAAFEAQTQGAGKAAFTWDQLTQRMHVLAIRAGNQVAPAFMTIMDSLMPLVDLAIRGVKWFSNLPQPIQTIALAGLGLTAALGPALMIIGNIGMTAVTLGPKLLALKGTIAAAAASGGTLTTILTGVKLAMSSLLGPVGLVVGGLGVLVAAWMGNWFGMRDITDNVINWISEKIQGFVEWVKNTKVMQLVSGIAGKVSGWFGGDEDVPASPARTAGSATSAAGKAVATARDTLTAGARTVIDQATQTVAGLSGPQMAMAGAGGMTVPASPAPYARPTPEQSAQQASTIVYEGDTINVNVYMTGEATPEEARDLANEVAIAIRREKERRPK